MLESRTPTLGAKVVAHAWVDPEFKRRPLAKGRAGCEDLGISFNDDARVIVLETTEKAHNLIVGTSGARTRWRSAPLGRDPTSPDTKTFTSTSAARAMTAVQTGNPHA